MQHKVTRHPASVKLPTAHNTTYNILADAICIALALIVSFTALPTTATTTTNSSQTLPSAPDIVYDTVNSSIDHENIYRIELLVFADISERHANDEFFDLPQSLTYPENVLHLFDLDKITPVIEQQLFDIEQLTDTSLDDIIISNNESEPDLELSVEKNSERDHQADKQLDDQAPAIPLLMVRNIDSIKSDTAAIYKTLKRRSRYRPLYHASWYQSLESRTSALPVVISGGRSVQDRFELEGTIKISKDRFLHIQPELWLVDWVLQDEPPPWYKRSRFDWSINAIPKRPDAHTVVKALEDRLATLNGSDPLNVNNQGSESRLRTTDDGSKNSDNTLFKRYQTAAKYLDINPNNVDKRVNPNDSDDLFAAAEAADIADTEQGLSDFIPPGATRIYRLAEKRRVKRDEVHYFDHPLFGLVITVSKWPGEIGEKK